MNTDVNNYFVEGCGRCDKYATPECKIHTWPNELRELRRIIKSCELTEESKWGMPTYTDRGKNILILSAFKNFASVNFFKGALIKDEAGILEKQGENQQEARILKFTDVKRILELEEDIRAYIFEAIEIERAGLKLDPALKKTPDYPQELLDKMEVDSSFKAAFEALTPGRQKGYLFHFNGAKQSATRASRIEKCVPKIMEGKGWNDR